MNKQTCIANNNKNLSLVCQGKNGNNGKKLITALSPISTIIYPITPSNPPQDIKAYIADNITDIGEQRLNCPLCDGGQEKTLSVNADSGVYICFRCGTKGNFKAEKTTMEPQDLWDCCKQCDSHTYATNKKISLSGLGLRVGNKGDLAVPFYIGDRLSTIQFISPNGDKCFISKEKYGAVKKGSSHIINGDNATVYVCEGIATGASVYEATGNTVIVTGDKGNIEPAIENLPKILKSNLVFCADNDSNKNGNGGLIACIKAAKRFDGKVVMPDQPGYDFNDLMTESGIEIETVKAKLEDFLDIDLKIIEPENNNKSGNNSTNPFLSKIITGDKLEESFIETLSVEWLIENIIDESSIVSALYGDTGAYKSFIALDMAMSIAAGIDFHKFPVKQCPTAYIAAEGQRGILKRMKVWKKYHNINKVVPCTVLTSQVKINVDKALECLVEALSLQPDKPGFLVIDTLARSLQGNENSIEDMGSFITACATISEKLNCQVMFVHHPGKDKTRGMRGGYNLTCDVDTVIMAKKEKDFVTTLKNEKQREYEEFEPIRFKLEKVDSGFKTKKGKPIDSLVPVMIDGNKPKQDKPKEKNKKEMIIKLIEDGLSVKNIIEKTGVTKSYVSQIKKSLQKA